MKYQTMNEKFVREKLEELGVPVHEREAAWQSIRDGYEKAHSWKCIFANLSAPFVVPLALLFTKWEDEHLPKAFDWYNNDCTVNGDYFQWDGAKPLMPISLDPDDVWAKENNFYNKGKHPRTFGSRYIWVGTRNRGKKTYEDYPTNQPTGVQRTWGPPVTRGGDGDETVTGWEVVELDGRWCLQGVNELAFGYYQENRWGWKTGLWQYHNRYFGWNKVLAVGVNFKIRKPKKG